MGGTVVNSWACPPQFRVHLADCPKTAGISSALVRIRGSDWSCPSTPKGNRCDFQVARSCQVCWSKARKYLEFCPYLETSIKWQLVSQGTTAHISMKITFLAQMGRLGRCVWGIPAGRTPPVEVNQKLTRTHTTETKYPYFSQRCQIQVKQLTDPA